MATALIQPSFAAGELAPSLWSRVDLAKYHVGARRLRNMFVHPHGGVSNRPGTQFVGRALSSTHPVRLVPFQFSTKQAYILEFGHLTMRVIKDGGYVLEPAKVIAAIAAPGTLTVPNHGFAVGDQVFIAGAMPVLDSTPGRQYRIATATDSAITLTDLDGRPVDTTAMGTYGGGATVARVYTLATPYDAADLALLKWTQSADTMTLCHPSYSPRDLTRTDHHVWTLKDITFAPAVAAPTGLAAWSSNGAGSWFFAYVVTAECDVPPGESVGSAPVICVGTALNQNTGVYNTVSWGAVPGAARYRVYKATPVMGRAVADGATFGYVGQSTGTSFTDMNVDPDFTQTPPRHQNPFSTQAIGSVHVANGGAGYGVGATINVIDATGYGAKLAPTIAGGRITGVQVLAGGSGYKSPQLVVVDGGGSGAVVELTVAEETRTTVDPETNLPTTLPAGTYAIIGAIVRQGGGGYNNPLVTVSDSHGGGCVLSPVLQNGIITAVQVLAKGTGYSRYPQAVVTDGSGSGAQLTAELTGVLNNPGVCEYFEQRRIFAGSMASPQTIWMSQSGDYSNMDTSSPSRDTDAITVTIAARQVNAIKHLVPMQSLLVMTSGGAWKMSGGNQSAVLTPAQTVVTPQAYTGCADVPPIIINSDVLYVQAAGSTVRDLSYDFYADVYKGADMSVLSNHLFRGYAIKDWAYTEEPHKLVWAVRSDGRLLTFAYLKEQDVYAWSWAESPGHSGADRVLSVAAIPEGAEHALYLVVERSIPAVNGGRKVRYVERMASRNMLVDGVADVAHAWFVDCGLRYQGAPTRTVSGLDHLEGCTVAILADGNVLPSQRVVGGRITIQHHATIITVGLPYRAEVQTLPLDVTGGATVQGKRKHVSAVTVRLENSRGMKVGTTLDSLVEVKERNNQPYGSPIELVTCDERVVLHPGWTTDGSIWIVQDNPLPLTVLGIIPEVQIGDN